MSVVILLASAPALAQTTDLDKAQSHFAAGRNHRAAGRCDLAIEEFSRAIDFEPNTVGPRLNLGDCYVERGRLPDAFRQFKEAERIAALTRDDRRLEKARKSAADVEAKMVRVILREGDARIETITVSVDGVEVGTGPWFIVATPGVEHEIRATAPDARSWSAKAKGDAGSIVRLTIAIPAPHALPTEPAKLGASKVEPDRDRDRKALRGAAFVTGGAGIVGLAAGVVAGALALNWRSELADAVTNDPRCSGAYPGGCGPEARGAIEPIQDRAYTGATVSTVAFVAGAVLLATAAAFYWFSRPTVKRDARIGPGNLLLQGTQ